MLGCGMVWCGMQSSLVRAIRHYLPVLSAPATPMFSAALANKSVKFVLCRDMEPVSQFQK